MGSRAIPAVIALAGLVLAASGVPAARAGTQQGAALPATGRTIGGPGALELVENDNVTLWKVPPGTLDVCLTATVQRGRLEVALWDAGAAVLRSTILDAGQARAMCGEGVASATVGCLPPVVPAGRPVTCRGAWRLDLLDADRVLTVATSLPGGFAQQPVVTNGRLGVACATHGLCWGGLVPEDASVVLDAKTGFCVGIPCTGVVFFGHWTGCDSTGPGSGGPDSACTVKMNTERAVTAVFQ